MSVGISTLTGESESHRTKRIRLVLISTAALYCEVMLIRWVGTEIRIFAFFQNLALIACFLGFGLGCYRVGERSTLLPSLKALTVLVVMVTLPIPSYRTVLVSISDLLGMSPDAAMWGMGDNVFGTEQIAAFILAGAIVSFFIILLMSAMVEFGKWVSFYMDDAPDLLHAYSLNLIGSVAGIWLMTLVSFLHLKPVYWFCVLFALMFFCGPRSRRLTLYFAGLLAVIVAFLLVAPHSGEWTFWSPYQKIEVRAMGEENYEIEVNNSTYMRIANRTEEFLSRHPDYVEGYKTNSYDSPFQFAASKDRVLIVGAGAGNDISAALRCGAQRVDAVEIDPVIYSLGKRLHPERPYDSPRVKIFINDARNFMRESGDKYDVIVFGLLDSHTGFSSYSNMRVDNYVYTEEAFISARRLLKPNGILVLKFEVRSPWLWMGQRFASMLNDVFGRAPIAFHGPATGSLSPATVYIESNSGSLWDRVRQPELSSLLIANPVGFSLSSSKVPPPTTDDWPFVYHQSHTIPRTYLTVTLILLLLAFSSVRHVFAPRDLSAWHFLLLGAGFLLLETQLISRLALYFGTTWFVNCVALTALLTVLVISNVLVGMYPQERVGRDYVLLVASLLAVYFVPWNKLPYSSQVIGTCMSLAFSVPIFFAGIIFAESFRRAVSKPRALGSNVFGAVIGGLLQNLSFLIGIKALLLIAAAIYTGAFVCQQLGRSQFPIEARVYRESAS